MMRRVSLTLLIIILVFSLGCEISEDDGTDDAQIFGDDDATDDDDDAAATGPPVLTLLEQIVPSEMLPDEVEPMPGNNNLDIVMHEGRLFFAFRSAPSHFASTRTVLYVISSADQVTWDFEAAFTLGTDLREPRLLSFDGELFLYFALLGQSPIDFEPGGMMVTQYMGPANWAEAIPIGESGFIPWRTKVVAGVPYMLGYVGGGGIYDLNPDPIKVHWLTTEDGYDWRPVVPDQPVVLEGGVSETDFVFLDNGDLIAVSRNEMGDETGFGMKICRADANALGDWDCVNDPNKYDSPLLFTHNNDVYLIGRRNLSDTGNFDLGYDDLNHTVKHLLYELDYWMTPKRTALWQIDTDTLAVRWVLDFPSKGDTCFPGMVQLSDDQYLIYNYTSPIDGNDVPWLLGQLGPTSIWSYVLEFVGS